MSAAPPLIALRKVSRYFGAIEALVDVDLIVRAREVVALVGDNGAGKSTLARVVAGVVQPSSGIIEIDGDAVTIGSPSAANRLGIASVFQESALAENLDVTANVFLGQELSTGGVLREEEMVARTRELLRNLTVRIPAVDTPLRHLSAGQRQAVAIARTLVGSPRIVVLDEPTAALSVAQTAEVLTYVQKLRDLGLGVILISHNLNDVRAVADRIEVLRLGRNRGSYEATTSQEELIAAITGAA